MNRLKYLIWFTVLVSSVVGARDFAIDAAKQADEFNERYSIEKKGIFLYQYSSAGEDAYQKHKSNLLKSERYANENNDDSFNGNVPSYEEDEDFDSKKLDEENEDDE
jgi:hypothetical protein